MASPDSAVQKHSIVASSEEITMRTRDFAARLDPLDDPHAGSARRQRVWSPNFNEIALLIDHLTGSR